MPVACCDSISTNSRLRPILEDYCEKEIRDRILSTEFPRIKSCPKIESKNCGLLTILGRLPQAPSRRKSAAPLLLLFDCVTNVTPFPQKSQTLALNSREDASPKASTHRSYRA